MANIFGLGVGLISLALFELPLVFNETWSSALGFDRGITSSQTIGWEKLLEAGSLMEARNKGWLRSEGKEYVVDKGDVMEFLFNV